MLEIVLLICGGFIGIVANHFFFKKKPLSDEQVHELWSVYANNKGGIVDIVRQVERVHGIK